MKVLNNFENIKYIYICFYESVKNAPPEKGRLFQKVMLRLLKWHLN